MQISSDLYYRSLNYKNNTIKNYNNTNYLLKYANQTDTVSFTQRPKKENIDDVKTSYNNDNKYTGWMTFQSKVNAPDEFNDNLTKLDSIISLNKEMENTYSHIDLRYNDINLFLENGIPQIGFMIDNNEVQKLKGTSVEGQVSPKYFGILQQKIRNYDIDTVSQESLTKTVSAMKEIQHFKDKLGKPIEEASSLELLDAAGMVEKSNDENGEIILSRYGQPSKNYFM